MSVQFTADEVFEMAGQMEDNGAKFYRKAAAVNATEKGKTMLLELAEMEDGHKRVFDAMRAAAKPAGDDPFFDPDGEGAAYLRAVSDNRVFNVEADPSAFIRADTPLADILRKAIGLEKHSIVFYLGIKDLVPEGVGKDKIDAIIKEEMGHVTLLTDKLVEQQTAG